MLPVFIPSAQFCRACKWGSLSISTSFYTNARYVMWTALTLTMFSHWTSSLWWFLVSWLTLAIWCLCFGLLSTSERPVHWIYVWKGGGGGKWLTAYFLLIPLMILPRRFFSDFWNFYTKPIILMSWYYLSAQISAAAQLQPVFCKFQ